MLFFLCDSMSKNLMFPVSGTRVPIKGFSAKLTNPGYLKGAPENLIAETREMLALAEADLAAAQSALDALPEE